MEQADALINFEVIMDQWLHTEFEINESYGKRAHREKSRPDVLQITMSKMKPYVVVMYQWLVSIFGHSMDSWDHTGSSGYVSLRSRERICCKLWQWPNSEHAVDYTELLSPNA